MTDKGSFFVQVQRRLVFYDCPTQGRAPITFELRPGDFGMLIGRAFKFAVSQILHTRLGVNDRPPTLRARQTRFPLAGLWLRSGRQRSTHAPLRGRLGMEIRQREGA